jgi:NDP-sugar pyrophosphorylase family protein
MNNAAKIEDCKAMVFAAGFGSRLKPFTDNHPKALAMVNDKTLLERNLAYLKNFGIKDIVINVFHFADQIHDFLSTYTTNDLRIVVSQEVEGPFETGGGLAFASKHFIDSNNPFVVMNVDMLTNLDLNGMFDFHQTHLPLATLAVTQRESSRQLLFNQEMILVGWRNQKTNEFKWCSEEVKDFIPFSFSGIHIIDPAIFNLMPSSGVFSIMDIYLKIAAEHPIKGYNHTGDKIIDVGKPESILTAETLFNNKVD